MKIWVNCIVRNEENFIWFAIMGVVDYVDKLLVWDTGSTDKTVEIIKAIIKEKGDKVEFKEVGEVDDFKFTQMRQAQLMQSKCDWILILDGDEVWWKNSIKKVINIIDKQGDNLDVIVVPFFNALGDIYHYQTAEAGQYRLLGKTGHLTIRAINKKISGLHVAGPYGEEGYRDKDNLPIQERDYKRLLFIEAPFLHVTHLRRSSQDNHGKFKYELGKAFPKDFQIPEVFLKPRPEGVSPRWNKRNMLYEIISRFKYPFLKFKRKM